MASNDDIENVHDNVVSSSSTFLTAAAIETVETALATATAAIAPTAAETATTVVATVTPPFIDTSDMPQWRKELIQRKKKLMHETVAATTTKPTTAAAAAAAATPLTSQIDSIVDQQHNNQSLYVSSQTMSFNNDAQPSTSSGSSNISHTNPFALSASAPPRSSYDGSKSSASFGNFESINNISSDAATTGHSHSNSVATNSCMRTAHPLSSGGQHYTQIKSMPVTDAPVRPHIHTKIVAATTATAAATLANAQQPTVKEASLLPIQSTIRHENEHIALSSSKQSTDPLTNAQCQPFRNSVIGQLVQPNKTLYLSSKKHQKQSNSAGYSGVSLAIAKKYLQTQSSDTISPGRQNKNLNCVNMVAMELITNGGVGSVNGKNYNIDDPSEELQYGPGIVSKLRCRYLSLALRQQTNKQRPSIDNLRRATSLNNLLDEDDEDDVDDEDDEEDSSSKKSWNSSQRENNRGQNNGYHMGNGTTMTAGNGHHNNNIINNHHHYSQNRPISIHEYQHEKLNDGRAARQIGRGNDSLKRARSVEALVRYDNVAWRRDIIKDSDEYPSSNPIILDELIVSDHHPSPRATGHLITIEDKIQSTRERNETTRPKRLTSFMDETERPPPDLVKQTLLKFEATANRKPRSISRYGNGNDVAAKVNTYKTFMAQEKRCGNGPVLALSPTKKPMAKPRTTSPKPISLPPPAPAPAYSVNGNSRSSRSGVYNGPSLDVHTIRNNLEANRMNGMATIATPTAAVPVAAIRSPTPLTAIRIDTGYRTTKIIDSPAILASPGSVTSPRSPLSPSTRIQNHVRPPILHPPPDSPTKLKSMNDMQTVIISQLAKKTEHSSIQSPKGVFQSAPTFTTQQQPQHSPRSAMAVYDSEGEERNLSETESVDGSSSVTSSENGIINDSSTNGKKLISKSALENISKAGTTTKYQFETFVNTTTSNVGHKSYLPSLPGAFLKRNNVPTQRNSNGGAADSPPEPSVRQIGIIRPLVAEPKIPQRSIQSTMPSDNLQQQEHHHHANNSYNIVPSASLRANDVISQHVLSSREIQKNQINREKSGGSVVVVVGGGDADDCQLSVMPDWLNKRANVSAIATAATNGTTTSTAVNQSNSNSMVFNFKHRKDVPDYIENDGLVIRRKREMPKPGESGFVLLGDLTVETSTDPEPEDSWTLGGPPSPLDVSFHNDNVIINGRSNMKTKSKDQKQLSIQFNESLTSTFEYPSENSMYDEPTNGIPIDDYNSSLDVTDLPATAPHNGGFLSSNISVGGNGGCNVVPIGSVPLGNYQPVKATTFTNNFELGVTRTTSPSQQINSTTSNQSSAGNGKIGINSNNTKIGDQQQQTQNNGIDNNMDSIQYLKPASDEQIVAWSEGVSDLLF